MFAAGSASSDVSAITMVVSPITCSALSVCVSSGVFSFWLYDQFRYTPAQIKTSTVAITAFRFHAFIPFPPIVLHFQGSSDSIGKNCE